MKASNTSDVNDFLKFSINTPDPYEEEIPDMLIEIDRQHNQQKEQEENVKKQQEQHQSIQKQSQEGIIPPLGIAKPELVDEVLQNMGNDKKIMESIQEAERYSKESPWQTVGREAASYLARGAEAFLGGVGGFLNILTPELYEDEQGMPLGPGEEKQGFPSAEKLHEFTKEKTGKYLEPKTEREREIQDFTSDIGSMLSTPGLGVLSKLMLPAVGAVTKKALKLGGATEKQQDIGKLSMMGIASIANLGNAPAAASRAMNQAKDMIPAALEISAKPTQKFLTNLRSTPWFKTGSTPSKAPAMQMVEKMENLITPNGTLNLQEAMQLRKDINEARKGLGAFNIPPITDKKAARYYLDQVDKALLQSMEHYGANVNPQWWNNYNLANEAYGLTARTTKMADFIEKNAKPLQSDMARTLFHTGTAGLLGGVGLGGTVGALSGAVGAGAVAGQTYKIINRMIRSPVLRNHYADVLKATATGNVAVMNKALEKFDKAALKHQYIKEKNQ